MLLVVDTCSKPVINLTAIPPTSTEHVSQKAISYKSNQLAEGCSSGGVPLEGPVYLRPLLAVQQQLPKLMSLT